MLGSRLSVLLGARQRLFQVTSAVAAVTSTSTVSSRGLLSGFCRRPAAATHFRCSSTSFSKSQKAAVATDVAINDPKDDAAATLPAAKPFSDIPAMKGWPVLGFIPQMYKAMRSAGFSNMYHKLQLELGPIYKLKGIGNDWTVVVSGPEASATLFRAEGKHPSRGKHEENMMWIYKKINKPYPMFFTGGSEWKRIRSAGNKQILPQRVAKFVDPLCDIADDLMVQLDKHRDKDGNISDIRDFTVKWSFQGISYFVYGEKVDVYSGDPQLKEFMELGLKFIRSLADIAFALPLYKLHIHTKTYRDYVDTLNKLQDRGKQILERHHSDLKEAIKSETVDDSKAVGLLDQWMIEGKYTEEEALVLSCDMLAAGMDTTSNTAMFVLYELAKHPDVQERMYREIISVVGEKEHVTWEDIQNMKLVRNSIKETMRLYIPTGVLPRLLGEDVVLNGYQVPAGTSVMFNMITTGLDREHFSNPYLFNPDRWDKKTTEDNLTFTSLPFGFGPRMCYGRRLAELELYVLLSKIIPKFHISTEMKELKLVQKTVLTTDNPVKLKLTPR